MIRVDNMYHNISFVRLLNNVQNCVYVNPPLNVYFVLIWEG